MSLITRTYTFTDGTTAYGSQVESEIANIVTVMNSVDTGGTSLTTPKFSGNVTFSGATATTVPYLDGNKILTSSAVTPTELGYVSGVTSAIQTQISAKAPSASPVFTGVAQIASGTIAAPSFVFSAETTTGIYRSGANQIGFSIAGVNSILIGQHTFQFYDSAGTNFLECDTDTPRLIPRPDNTFSLGNSSFHWTAVYATNGTIQTSHSSTKENIVDLSDQDIVIPRGIRFNRPNEAETQIGFLADDLPEHCFVSNGNGGRSSHDVYTSSVIGILCAAVNKLKSEVAVLKNDRS